MPETINIAAGIALAVLILASWVQIWLQDRRLRNPNDKSVVYLDEIISVSNLSNLGPFLLRTLRQSGNLQKEDVVFESATRAIRAAVTTLKKANVEYVVITKNSPGVLCFRRPWRNHRGRSEGKRVGSVVIVALGEGESVRTTSKKLGTWTWISLFVVFVIVAWMWFQTKLRITDEQDSVPQAMVQAKQSVQTDGAKPFLTQERIWTDSAGRHVTATLVSLKKDERGFYVGVFCRPSGERFEFQIGNLSKDDVKLVKEIVNQADTLK